MRVNKFINIIAFIGFVLMLIQVAMIFVVDNYNMQLSQIDTSIGKLSEEYVSLDNYVTLYKSPLLLKHNVSIAKTSVIYINVTPNLLVSFDYAGPRDK